MLKAGTEVVKVVEGPPTTIPYEAGPLVAGDGPASEAELGGIPAAPDGAGDAGARPVNVDE